MLRFCFRVLHLLSEIRCFKSDMISNCSWVVCTCSSGCMDYLAFLGSYSICSCNPLLFSTLLCLDGSCLFVKMRISPLAFQCLAQSISLGIIQESSLCFQSQLLAFSYSLAIVVSTCCWHEIDLSITDRRSPSMTS